MAKETGWLEVYKEGGEWKIENSNGSVLRTESTKRKAIDRARGMLNPSGDIYYLGAQVYNTDGSKGERIVSDRAVKNWLRINSSRR